MQFTITKTIVTQFTINSSTAQKALEAIKENEEQGINISCSENITCQRSISPVPPSLIQAKTPLAKPKT